MKTIIEPFRIKAVEPIKFTTEAERLQLLEEAHYNPFLIKGEDVLIDLLTDSGTSAMSSEQWAGLMRGDESYAGSKSYYRFEQVVKRITNAKHIIPTHQGRASEKILFSIIGGVGKTIISNTLFDTTRANIEYSGAAGLDLVCIEGTQPSLIAPFKGNIDIERLPKTIESIGAANIPALVITITNNSGGGQPVSLGNIKAAKAICEQYKIPLMIDACRFAENAYFIKLREEGYANRTVESIAQEIFSYADIISMSAKKDAFANIGGFLTLQNDDLAMQCRNLLIITEGFHTYGGLAGRDLEAIAIGLDEIMQEDYLRYRIRSTEYVGEKLTEAGVPIVLPTGGHAVYIDAKAMLPHIPVHEFPGLALANALYIQGGIRGVEIGSVMFGKYNEAKELIPAAMELVRLAIPRRVYTQSHMDYVAETIIELNKNKNQIKGYKIIYEAPLLRHFTARFTPVN
jgi:tryptophanase